MKDTVTMKITPPKQTDSEVERLAISGLANFGIKGKYAKDLVTTAQGSNVGDRIKSALKLHDKANIKPQSATDKIASALQNGQIKGNPTYRKLLPYCSNKTLMSEAQGLMAELKEQGMVAQNAETKRYRWVAA